MGGGKMNGRLVGWGSGRFLSSSFSFNRESSSTSSSLKSIFGLRALQGQPQWNFAPFIFYSVVAACLRYVCTWTEEVLFLCANGIELLIKWVSWIHKANQSERQREVRICSLALQQLLRLIWQIQLLFVCCTNSSSVSSFCVSVCSVWWRLGIHSKNNHNKPIDGQDEWGKPTEERQIFFYFIFVIDFEKTSQFFYNTRYRK